MFTQKKQQTYSENKLTLRETKIINKHKFQWISFRNGIKHFRMEYWYNFSHPALNMVRHVARKELIIYFSCIIYNANFWGEKK